MHAARVPPFCQFFVYMYANLRSPGCTGGYAGIDPQNLPPSGIPPILMRENRGEKGEKFVP